MSLASNSTDSRNSTESAPILSPEKKRVRQTTQPDDSNDVQGESAQYHEDSTPADSVS
jgi:hypothetical protein